jgi:selenocysteine lyase/cysteine desulfurase
VTHLNNAGAALPPRIVTDTVVGFLRAEELGGGYEAHAAARERIAAAYTSIGTLVDCPPERVAITESATVAWGRAFAAIAFSRPFTARDRILVATAEYASNVIPILQVCERTGARLEFIPDDETGVLDVDALTRMLDDDVAVVAVTHCPSQNGLVNDVVGVGELLRGSSAWYVVDACQSVGQLDVDMSAIGADALAATGRKWLRGPRGTGFLALSERAVTELVPFPLDLSSATWTSGDGVDIASNAARFEYWERSYAGTLGLGAAVDYALEIGVDTLAARIDTLATRARDGLSDIAGLRVLDRGVHRSGIVTATPEDGDPADLVRAVTSAGINVSLSTPDYARHDFDLHAVRGALRASPHAYNTEEEVDRLVTAVDEHMAAQR